MTSPDLYEDPFLTVAQLAKDCSVTRQTVYNWISAGMIETVRLEGTRNHLIRRASLAGFVQPQRGRPLLTTSAEGELVSRIPASQSTLDIFRALVAQLSVYHAVLGQIYADTEIDQITWYRVNKDMDVVFLRKPALSRIPRGLMMHVAGVFYSNLKETRAREMPLDIKMFDSLVYTRSEFPLQPIKNFDGGTLVSLAGLGRMKVADRWIPGPIHRVEVEEWDQRGLEYRMKLPSKAN